MRRPSSQVLHHLAWHLALPLALVAGCAPQAQPIVQPTRAVGLSLDESKEVVQSFEARQAEMSKADPLHTPKSLDDVLEILKRDQIDLFGAGAEFAAKQEGPKAVVLRAQIELAWGEAQLILADLFTNTTRGKTAPLQRLTVKEASGSLSEQDKADLARLRKEVSDATRMADALTRLASEHVGAGAKLAREVIAKTPDDYHGYRLAADYYRLRQEWPEYDAMIKKIEELKSNSNGLLFLEGVAALQREGNSAKASKLFREALEHDPQFTRAQAQLVITQSEITDVYVEYTKLKALNPHHQIVVWAGDLIQSGYDAWNLAQQAKSPTDRLTPR